MEYGSVGSTGYWCTTYPSTPIALTGDMDSTPVSDGYRTRIEFDTRCRQAKTKIDTILIPGIRYCSAKLFAQLYYWYHSVNSKTNTRCQWMESLKS